ncbi:hypothetical protein COEREDRAFT_11888 [Coemansia reversa NRRL 1564]|uniref:CCHC-type domain-containing protein n=1 Tax=Coemansia reversa (strain ATCC 12441 / NRRL 1564) TaxID=763665 RepID=A0A2G5B1W9_COERN|nr:hypothetical protein COEREDRAFT_11888 [Coemansia reversa NRRL 1564]|eukprot:PIA12981.1 hypothetical protein COEREDRAFT_11888 [Coemansia reversa NRRL 1564]
MENDGNVEQDQVVQIPILTPAAEEPVTRQYEGSVAPLRLAWLAADASDRDAIAWVATAEYLAALLNVQAEQALMYVDPVLFSAWSTWRMQHPMECINGWAGFAAYIRLHRNPQNTHHGLALQLLQLSDEGHSILSFNDEFCHLYQALGEELGDVAITMYTSHLPAGLRTVVFSLGPDAILDTAMQVVAACVEAVCQAEVSGGAMEIDALGFGAFVPKCVTKCTMFTINGKSHGRSGGTMDLNRLRESFGRQGVSADVFNARWTNRQCLRCGSSNHLAAHCPTMTGNASGR